MKKIFLSILIVFHLGISAQKKSKKIVVPTNVKTAFEKDYPQKKAKWGIENDDFEAEFKINRKDASVVYDKNGRRKAFEIDIEVNKIPVNAIAYLRQNFPNNNISEFAKIIDDKDNITYEAEIQKNKKSFDVLFDANGKFVKIVEGD
jgi:uncharacterized membrane protein YkoI